MEANDQHRYCIGPEPVWTLCVIEMFVQLAGIETRLRGRLSPNNLPSWKVKYVIGFVFQMKLRVVWEIAAHAQRSGLCPWSDDKLFYLPLQTSFAGSQRS